MSSGFLRGQRYLLHDRDTKFCAAFLDVLRSSGIQPLTLPPKSPNLNAFAERWVGSIRQECLSKLILFGEASLRRALNEYLEHYHFERNHQGKDNLLLFPSPDGQPCTKNRAVYRRDRLGGLLRFYSRAASFLDQTGGTVRGPKCSVPSESTSICGTVGASIKRAASVFWMAL